MKFLIISLFILFSLSVGFVGVTQGEYWKDDTNLVEITVQIQLRDSEGRLVAYYEPTQIWVRPEIVDGHLDPKENKSIILKDGKKYEVFELEQTLTYRGNQLAYGFVLPQGDRVQVAYVDAFLSEPGDVAFQSWKVVRLLD